MKRLMLFGVLWVVGVGAATAATTQPTDTKIDVREVVTSLGSPVQTERFAATRALVKAFWWQEEEIEAASNRQDLEPKVSAELQRIVAQQKARTATWRRSHKNMADQLKANQTSAIAAYDQFGKRNPTWDEAAREFILTFTEIPNDPVRLERRRVRMGELREMLKKSGCDDPLVRYFVVRSRESEPDVNWTEIVEELREAAEALDASEHPAHRKCWAHARYVDLIIKQRLWEKVQLSKDEVEGKLDRAIELWPEAVKSDGMTDATITELAEMIRPGWAMTKATAPDVAGDQEALCDRLFPAWEQARPTEAGSWVLKGQLYIEYAWAARGTGFANTVTDNGWRRMAERLTVARQALERAYELDPLDVRAPLEMIQVEMGSPTNRAAMELWWTRAMKADPDNYHACSKKLYYLEPKWHGSPEEMIIFGRECVAAGNWDGRIPVVLAEAHATLANYAPDRGAYMAHPVVWRDLQSVYEPLLAWFPDSVWDRSYYAYYAQSGGHWVEAVRQFEILGETPELRPFGSKAAYDAVRDKARREAAKAAASAKSAGGKL